jgi:hypothetical protein
MPSALSRRGFVSIGGLSALGLGLEGLLAGRASAAPMSRKRNCIILFLLGGAPQQSTWDPKPEAPAEMRGAFGPISTKVPGLQIASLFPKIAEQADKIAFLRAVSTDDNAHSSSGYYMLTGTPHAPKNIENANPGAPNDFPNFGSLVRHLRGDRGGLPGAVRLPMHIFNTDQSIWPGQEAGWLGRVADPWLFRCEPASPKFQVPELTLSQEVPLDRLAERRHLFQRLDRAVATSLDDRYMGQAFSLLASTQARKALDLAQETPATRALYGQHQVGQSCLLARRLIEAGVSLVQVNWFRGADEPPDAPCWDSHNKETDRLKTVLGPTLDQALAALIADLSQRGLLDDTLVMCLSEFGRTPKFNPNGGRDHWGHAFSVALAGGGVKGGMAHGSTDRVGGYPRSGRVIPEDITATALHCLGYAPDTEIRDRLNRPLPASRGEVISAIL